MQNSLQHILARRSGSILLAILFLALTAWAWVGFLGSDDVTYAIGAYGWIEQFPFVGGHGTIRYPITIPMALSFLTFGHNEYAMVLPSYLAMVALLFCIWRSIVHISGVFPANLSLLLIVTLPLVVVQATIASVDIVEAFFLFASVIFYWRYARGEGQMRDLLFSGMLAGLAFLTRETAIFIAIFYALLFLRGYKFSRVRYLTIAAGFLMIWAVEIAYLWIMTGDPLFRFNISMNHDSTIDRSVDLAGNLIIHPAIDPLLVLLFNQEFMLLFWIGLPLALWFCFSGPDTVLRRFARIILLFGTSWFVCVGAAVTLLPLNPRYFLITALAIAIVSGFGLHKLWITLGRGRTAIAALLIMLSTNLLGIFVENRQPVFGERQLAEIAARNPEVIYTDPMTRYRADMLLKWENRQAAVRGKIPPPGVLFLYNPEKVGGSNRFMDADMQSLLMPKPEWKVVETAEPSPEMIVSLTEKIGANRFIPASIWQKLRYRHQPVTLYRIPDRTLPKARTLSKKFESSDARIQQ
jgi:4-amino-4-deoxy-L-arabinose transferase-like glycosyltransferase